MQREHPPHLAQFNGQHIDSWFATTAPAMERYPALGEVARCDVCIVGAGYTGLSCALELAERGLSVVVVEGALVGFAASGRNGGQFRHGFAASMPRLEKHLGLRAARQCWDASLEGIALLANRIHQHQIDCDLHWGFLNTAQSQRQLHRLRQQQALLAEYGYHDAQLLNKKDLHAHIDSPLYEGGLYDPGGGHLHPLKYAQGLAHAAFRAGVKIYEKTPATSIDEDRHGLQIGTPKGWVNAKQMVLACNVDIGPLQTQLRRSIVPATSHILATAPISAGQAQAMLPSNAAICDSNYRADYFRLTPDHRLLFGGWLGNAQGTSTSLIAARKARLARIFPALQNHPIEQLWHGYLDIGPGKLPQFGRNGTRIYHAQGFAGHGLALSGIAGKMIAQAIAGDIGYFDVFNRLYIHPLPLPASLESSLLRFGMLYGRLRDALGF